MVTTRLDEPDRDRAEMPDGGVPLIESEPASWTVFVIAILGATDCASLTMNWFVTNAPGASAVPSWEENDTSIPAPDTLVVTAHPGTASASVRLVRSYWADNNWSCRTIS